MVAVAAETLQRMATAPAIFQAELVIPSTIGPKRFADVMADFQQQCFSFINPALIAVALGKKPPTGRHWWEATKGASKYSDLAVCLLWLLAFTRRPLSCQVGAASQQVLLWSPSLAPSTRDTKRKTKKITASNQICQARFFS